MKKVSVVCRGRRSLVSVLVATALAGGCAEGVDEAALGAADVPGGTYPGDVPTAQASGDTSDTLSVAPVSGASFGPVPGADTEFATPFVSPSLAAAAGVDEPGIGAAVAGSEEGERPASVPVPLAMSVAMAAEPESSASGRELFEPVAGGATSGEAVIEAGTVQGETPGLDTSDIEAAERELLEREMAEREAAERERAALEAAEREAAEREAARREAAELPASEKDAIEPTAAAAGPTAAEGEADERETAEREAAEREAAEREAAEREAAEREAAEREAAEREAAEREAAEREAAEREAAEREAAEREAAEREAAEREAAEREAAEREAAEREAASSNEIIVGSAAGDARCLALPSGDQGFGSIDKSDWRSWLSGVRYTIGDKHLSLDTTPSGRQTLRQRFIPSSRGTDRVIMAATVPEARTYRFMQSVYLEPGWDWGGEKSQGGKMGFGLGGGTAASGGKKDPSGFTSRWIWRGNRDGTAKIAVYSYAADRPGTYGEDIYLEGFPAPIGEWFDLIMEVKLNSSTGRSDGSLRAWANGDLLLHRSNMAWQTAGGTPSIDSFLYSTFYGGSSSAWSPDSTTHLRLADVCWSAVVDGYSGIDPDAGRIRAPGNDRPGGPGVQLDGAPGEFAAADRGLRGSVRGLIESARVVTEFMLPSGDALADAALLEAVDHMSGALDARHWISADAPDIYAPALLGLREAIEAADRAVHGAAPVSVGEDVAVVVGELSEATRQLVDAAIAEADSELDAAGCRTSSANESCRGALTEFDRATSERELMALASRDVVAAEHAREAWTRATEVLRALY